MIRANWLHLYHRLPEMRGVIEPRAIVSYGRWQKAVRGTVTKNDPSDPFYTKLMWVSEWSHELYLDLWLVILRFDWITKGREPKR